MATSVRALLQSMGMAAIPAFDIKEKTVDAAFKKTTVFTNQDARAGKTYTVTGRVILMHASLGNLTLNDTKTSLTCDGKVVSRALAEGHEGSNNVTGINLFLLEDYGIGILCDSGFSLYAKTTTDPSITVNLEYLELE